MNQDAIYDARQLGVPKMLLLGLQHMFAMFGATILVPAITGLSISATLLFAGLGTLLFHLITGRKVPAFLGSSFAFLGAYGLVTASGAEIRIPALVSLAPVFCTLFWLCCSRYSVRRRSCGIFRPLSPARLSLPLA